MALATTVHFGTIGTIPLWSDFSLIFKLRLPLAVRLDIAGKRVCLLSWQFPSADFAGSPRSLYHGVTVL